MIIKIDTLSESKNTIRLSREDRQALAQIGNIPWRDWHYHLYMCRQCRTGTKCSRGQDLFRIAEDQPKPKFLISPTV